MRLVLAFGLAVMVATPVVALEVVDVPGVGRVWAFNEDEVQKLDRVLGAMRQRIGELTDRVEQLEEENAKLKERVRNYQRSAS